MDCPSPARENTLPNVAGCTVVTVSAKLLQVNSAAKTVGMVGKHSWIVSDPHLGRAHRAALSYALCRNGVCTSFAGRMIEPGRGNRSQRGASTTDSIHGPDYTVVCGIDDGSRVLLRLAQREGS